MKNNIIKYVTIALFSGISFLFADELNPLVNVKLTII